MARVSPSITKKSLWPASGLSRPTDSQNVKFVTNNNIDMWPKYNVANAINHHSTESTDFIFLHYILYLHWLFKPHEVHLSS